MKTDKPQIDRSSSGRSRPYNKEERLWAPDLKRLVEMIKDHVDLLEQYKNSARKQEALPTLSIAIFSPSGAGKSSLLKTLVDDVNNQGSDCEDNPLRRVATLDILQPSRFGENGELVYAMVAAGLDAHRKEVGDDFDYEVLTPVLQKYRNLSRHLRIIRGEKIDDNLDANELASELIERHTSAFVIGKAIDEFIDELADNLNHSCGKGNSVLLLPVDDIDIETHQLIQGLKQLQAYLRHPRLIPIFCFTEGLAEDTLYDHYTAKLKHADLKRKGTGRIDSSEQLAIQYLSKCFPVRNRLRLGAVPANLQRSTLIAHKESTEKETDTFGLLFTASFLLFGVTDREALHHVRAALRPSTVRRQFHVIDAIFQSKVNLLIHENEQIIIGDEKLSLVQKSGQYYGLTTFTEKTWITYFNRTAWAILNVHRDVIQEYGMQMEDLYSWSPTGLRRVLLNALLNLGAKAQTGLWRYWRNMHDSRRNQIISLLALTAHKPWLEGELPSGEDYSQLKAFDSGSNENNSGDSISAHLGLLWFLNVTLGFYLPLNQSVFRVLRETDYNERFDGSGWNLRNAPIQAAQMADENHEFFSTGMLFLDPLTYATALTTPARLAACLVLDEANVTDPQLIELVLEAKVFFLREKTKTIIDAFDKVLRSSHFTDETSLNIHQLEAALVTIILGKEKKNILAKVNSLNMVKIFKQKIVKALGCYRVAAYREIYGYENDSSDIDGKAKDKLQKGKFDKLDKIIEYLKIEQNENKKVKKETSLEVQIKGYLERHNYKKAREHVDDYKNAKKSKKALSKEKDFLNERITKLELTSIAVHDDQLMLRIWTCHGYNRGRFWATVSLWRGLGLVGELLEGYRKWKKTGIETKEEKAKYIANIKRNIIDILHTHSLKGSVLGKGLSKPAHREDTFELAFPGWNTTNQRDACKRLATRLANWLTKTDSLNIYPFCENDGKMPDWSQCFIRRLHGGYIAGSLWQWLDIEHFEYQGHQSGKSHRYKWNAGIALTSWLRVVQRYFRGNLNILWLLEACPLTSPFLSRSGDDPFIGNLCNQSYVDVLEYTEADSIEGLQDNTKKADHLFDARLAIQRLWQDNFTDDEDQSFVNKVAIQAKKTSTTRQAEDGWQRLELMAECKITTANLTTFATKILETLLKEQGENTADWAEHFKVKNRDIAKSFKWLSNLSNTVQQLIYKNNKDDFDADFTEKYIEYLLASFNSRIEIEDTITAKDKAVICFELASLILQHWKITSCASTSSLFYQISRVERDDFFW
jgi:hypothetical protein